MYQNIEINLKEEKFFLLPQKALFRVANSELIISDLHLGKATHFQKNGIALPRAVKSIDLENLQNLILLWKPKKVTLLGDLFHSELNSEWYLFKNFLELNKSLQFILVKGNHDILNKNEYLHFNFKTEIMLEEKHFIFTHEPLKKCDKLNFCGHIHPGIKITGNAKQSVTLPCFYFCKNTFMLPAFGSLTGLHILKKNNFATYYLITNKRVIRYSKAV